MNAATPTGTPLCVRIDSIPARPRGPVFTLTPTTSFGGDAAPQSESVPRPYLSCRQRHALYTLKRNSTGFRDKATSRLAIEALVIVRCDDHSFMRHCRSEHLAVLVEEHHINITQLGPGLRARNIREEASQTVERLNDFAVVGEPTLHRSEALSRVAVPRLNTDSSRRLQVRQLRDQRVTSGAHDSHSTPQWVAPTGISTAPTKR